VTYAYDFAHRLTGISDELGGEPIFAASYTLDAAGQRVAADVTLPLDPIFDGDGAFDLTDTSYNELNQLEWRETGGQLFSYLYDLDGNLESGVVCTAAMACPEASHGEELSLYYDELNQLVEAGDLQAGYDVDGLRVMTTTGGRTRWHVQDPNARYSRLLEERDGNGNLIARYVYGLGLISRHDPAGDAQVYHFDSRGSTVALTDVSTGKTTDKYAYDPYGLIVNREATTENPTEHPFTFNGRDGVQDDGNGLYFMRARYYAPELKRFIQKDQAFAGTLTDTQSLNRYAFARGDPVRFVDPTGEIPDWLVNIGIALAVIAFAVSLPGAAGLIANWLYFEKATVVGFAILIGLASIFIGFFDIFTDSDTEKELQEQVDSLRQSVEGAYDKIGDLDDLRRRMDAKEQRLPSETQAHRKGRRDAGVARREAQRDAALGEETKASEDESPGDVWNEVNQPQRDVWASIQTEGCVTYAWTVPRCAAVSRGAGACGESGSMPGGGEGP
jgi:RHS repeat-associated protein